MVKIEPYFDDAPAELWNEASKKRNKTENNPQSDSKIKLALSQKGKHDFDREIYALSVVKLKLISIFHSKCGFCETNTHAGAHKDVEHYRFKNHYYWLGYEWSNLLLSCQICNRNFKKTKFPIEDESKRVSAHPINKTGELDRTQCHILSDKLQSEKPLLLHPAIDNPNEHLRFLANGSVEGFTLKGETSIKVYGLKRDKLIKAREKIVLQMQKDIWEEYKLSVPNEERIILEVRKVINKLMSRIDDKDSEYIGFSTAILENFESFIIDNQSLGIDMPDKDIMRQAARAILL